MSSIKNKAVKGVKWSIIDNIANSGITFLVGIILARILTPHEFGLIGIITIFISIANTIIDGGFSTALIRKPDSTNEDYNTVFYCNLGISIFLTLIFCLSATSIANFYEEPKLISVIYGMSSLLIINAFTLIQRTLLIKKIDFKTQAKISLSSSIVSGFIGIALALFGFGVWSLVFQQISRQLIVSVSLWIKSLWKPSFLFSKKSFDELFHFGSKILIADIINTFFRNIFLALVGKFYSTEKLGQYTKAEQFKSIFANNLTLLIQKVSFPSLSSIQNEKERLTFAFRKLIIYTSIITFAGVLSLGAIAKPLILVLIGEQWLEAVEYLQIICFYGILYPLSVLNLNMLKIIGKSNLILKQEFIKKLLLIPVLVVGYFFDFKYMLWAHVIYFYIEFFFNSFYSERFFNYGTWKQIKDLFPIFILSLVLAFGIWSITLIPFKHIIINLLIQCVLIATIFPLTYSLIRSKEYFELKDIIVTEIKSFFSKK
ncbi:lipopolysaccharide biosynthesis protein [Bacteroidales bacterium OttesenSCG-928-C19]|nr:lipopolysaccharide biosynthesis protein [Bacteroidales bacterium OttesenSCG-928-C19]